MNIFKKLDGISPAVGQFIRFALVGILNVIIDLSVLNILILVFKTGQEGIMYAIFKVIAFIAAVINSYIFNRLWVFKSQEGKKGTEFTAFVVVSVIGAFINAGVATLVATYISPISLDIAEIIIFVIGPKLWPTVAAMCGSVSAIIWNFIGYKVFVFKKSDQTQD